MERSTSQDSNTLTMPRHRHTIKTYLRRESRITPAQRKALTELLGHYELAYSEQQIDVRQEFPDSTRFSVEIGFGDGDALIWRALTNPQTAYLGIEVYRPGVGKCLHNLHHNNVKNVRVSTVDARDVLQFQIPENSIDELVILFPDPWPKARHRKRRLLNAQFVNLCVERIVPSGAVHIATDSSDYAEQILEILDQHKELKRITLNRETNPNQLQRRRTKYEQKGKDAGNRIFEMVYTRRIELQPSL